MESSAKKDTSHHLGIFLLLLLFNNAKLQEEPEASIDIKDDLSESQYVEIGSPGSHQGKGSNSKSRKRPLNPFGKQNKKEVTSHVKEKRSTGSSTNKSINSAVAYTTHQSDKAPYVKADQDISPSFSSETTKAINYLTFSAPNIDRYESFKKYLQNKPQTNTTSTPTQPASLTDRLIKDDVQDDCKCINSETCPHTKINSSALRTERSHITFNMEALKQNSQPSDRDALFEHPTPTLKIENLYQDADSIESDSSPQNLEEATRKALQNLSFKLEASQSSENIMSNTSVNSDMYRNLEGKDSKEKVNSQFNLSKYLTPNLSEIKRNSITNELNMFLHRPSQQSEFINTEVVLNISTLTANSSRKESTVEKLREFMAQKDAENRIEGLEYNTKDAKSSSDKNESTPEHHHNFNRNNFASITSSTGYKSAAANQKKAFQEKNHFSQDNQNEERGGIAEHLLKFAAGEIEPNSFNELSFSMDNPLPEKLSISSPERLHTEPSSIRNDSNLFGTNSEVLRNHSPDNCEKHTLQLNGATKNINVRTFMMLRSLIKPNDNILLCCQAFVKLFAGLSEAIPSSFANMDKIEWGNIKVLFNAPLKILNLISSYTSFVEYEKIPQKNINAALASLAKIPYDINTETQNEAFYQMYEYVVSAIEYHKYYKPGTPLYTPKRNRSPEYQRVVKTEADYIQDSPPLSSSRSKSPIKSSTRTQDLSTLASNRFSKASTSPIRDPLSTSRTPLEDRSARNMNQPSNTSLNGSKSATKLTVGKKPFSTVKSKIKEQMQHQLSKSSQAVRYPDKVKRNQEVDSYLDNLRGERQNTHQTYRTYTEGDQDYITERARTLEPVWVESSRLISETERRKKEATEYRGKTGRLLADHERYVKRLMKARGEAEDELDRELKIQERERLDEYLYVKREMNKSYDQQLAVEKIKSKRETKVRQARAEKESVNDDIVENMKHHCYLATQSEKKKFDKKKQLWEQYKNILAEKMAKKKTEAKETHREKQEMVKSRIGEFAFQKQQATENRDKWVSNYMLLSELIGNTR